MPTFTQLVALPENRLALAAAQRAMTDGDAPRLLFLHGPPGTGKTHLAQAMAQQTKGRIVAANELASGVASAPRDSEVSEAFSLSRGTDATPLAGDFLVIEDVQHLPARSVETLVQLLDERSAHDQQTVLTATLGPGRLPFPLRLVSRLAAGLVVELQPFSATSRLAVLQQLVRRRSLDLPAEVLAWLADNLTGGGRQLDGALTRVAALAQLQARPLDVETVAGHFHEDAEAGRPTVERIVRRVGGHFQVDPRQMKSRRRCRSALLPRQVSMYLARQLTGLTLEEIGSWFGGRDHSTVLHACRKVAETLDRDADLAGTVNRLHAELA